MHHPPFKIVCAVIGGLLIAFACRQEKWKDSELWSTDSVFIENEVDIGNVLRGQTVEAAFRFRDGVTFDQDTLRTVCSCGCLERNSSLNSESSKTMIVAYTASRALGPFKKTCEVLHNGSSLATLVVKGDIVPEVIISPNELDFEPVAEGNRPILLKVTRVGISKEDFSAIAIRPASSAIRVSKVSHSDDEAFFHCTAVGSLGSGASLGLYCELDLPAQKHEVAYVRCRNSGPFLKPPVAVMKRGQRQIDEVYVFTLTGSPSILLTRLQFSDERSTQFFNVRYVNPSGGDPHILCSVVNGREIPSGTYVLNVYYKHSTIASPDKCISLPLRVL